MSLNNSQYDAIMREYQQQQLQNEHDRRKRCQHIYAQIPRIREIDETIAASSAEQARKRIMGDTNALIQLRKTVSQLHEEKEVLLRRYHYPIDYMEMKYHCKDCQDTGYINQKPCHCFKQATINLLYRQSNIQSILKKENFSTLKMDYYSNDIFIKEGQTLYDYMKNVINFCRTYAVRFPDNGKNIFFTGKTGTGKTFLSNCIAAAVMEQCHSVIYLTASHLFDLFAQETFEHDDEAESALEHYVSDCDLLIIDDLGTEVSNSFTISKLFYCINQRLTLKKSTIISSNLNPNEIRDLYSDRIASRILGYYEVIFVLGKDIRTLKKYRE
ncbi:MAG: ATP-binding protein [Lachnospiraceae bacterium]